MATQVHQCSMLLLQFHATGWRVFYTKSAHACTHVLHAARPSRALCWHLFFLFLNSKKVTRPGRHVLAVRNSDARFLNREILGVSCDSYASVAQRRTQWFFLYTRCSNVLNCFMWNNNGYVIDASFEFLKRWCVFRCVVGFASLYIYIMKNMHTQVLSMFTDKLRVMLSLSYRMSKLRFNKTKLM